MRSDYQWARRAAYSAASEDGQRGNETRAATGFRKRPKRSEAEAIGQKIRGPRGPAREVQRRLRLTKLLPSQARSRHTVSEGFAVAKSSGSQKAAGGAQG